MKSFSKIILALMILVSSASAQSFTQPGTVELGGDISLSSQTETNANSYYYPSGSNTQTTFSFNPYFGVMVARGLELGISPGISIQNPGASTLLNMFFAPSYNFNTQSNIFPYVEFLVGYNSDNEDGTLSSGLGIGGDVGFKLAIKGSSLFLFKIEYINQSFTSDIPSSYYYSNYPFNYTSSQFKYSVGTLFVGVGFRMFIPRIAKATTPAEKGK